MASTDRWEPKLRVKASNLGGSGYRIPTRLGDDGKPILVPGVTTVNNAIAMPGIVQWAVDQTAAYASANPNMLLNRTEEQGFYALRYYHNRKADFDDPEVDINNYHTGVLNDLAELGSRTHDWISDFVTGGFPDDPFRDEQAQMISAFLDWWDRNEVEVIETEVTVVGNGYAGTLDHMWVVNGVPMLIDAKTSRALRDNHLAQIGALGAAESLMREVPVGTESAVEYKTERWGKTYWQEDVIPPFTHYGVLHLRPRDWDDKAGEFRDAFCKLHVIPQEAVDAGYRMFRGALEIKHAQRQIKKGEWLV